MYGVYSSYCMYSIRSTYSLGYPHSINASFSSITCVAWRVRQTATMHDPRRRCTALVGLFYCLAQRLVLRTLFNIISLLFTVCPVNGSLGGTSALTDFFCLLVWSRMQVLVYPNMGRGVLTFFEFVPIFNFIQFPSGPGWSWRRLYDRSPQQ